MGTTCCSCLAASCSVICCSSLASLPSSTTASSVSWSAFEEDEDDFSPFASLLEATTSSAFSSSSSFAGKVLVNGSSPSCNPGVAWRSTDSSVSLTLCMSSSLGKRWLDIYIQPIELLQIRH